MVCRMNPNSAALSPFGVQTTGPTINDLPPAARAFFAALGQLRVYLAGVEVQRQMAAPRYRVLAATGAAAVGGLPRRRP